MEKTQSSSASKKPINSESRAGVFDMFFEPPCNERDIIFFQKMLITQGIHQFYVTSLAKGRKALFTLLSSIPMHQRKACISNNFEVIGEIMSYNLYHKLNNLQQSDSLYSLEQLWAEGQHFDFLWIERSYNDNPLYMKFCEQAIQIFSNKELSIIVLEEKP